MGIDVSLALEEGASRLATVPGAIVAGLFVLAGLVEVPINQTISSRAVEWIIENLPVSPMVATQLRQQMETTAVFDLGIGIQPAFGMLVVVFLLVIAFRVVGIRVFASAETGVFPTESVTYKFGVSVLFVLLFELALIATMLVLVIGPFFVLGAVMGPTGAAGGANGSLLFLLVYLIVLGIFIVLPVLLYFARQEIVLGEKNPIAAIQSSWGIAKANFGAVFVLLALIFILNVVGGLLIGTVLGTMTLVPLITTTFGRIVAVFGIAVSTRAYLQTQ